MARRRHERTLARNLAVQVLYQSAITGRSVENIIEENAPLPDGSTITPYAATLLTGVSRNAHEIDGMLAQASKNWTVERMPIIDHAIMRLATYEMIHELDVPVSVCINEAVELAKSYGGEDESARFVNGILGQIARTEVPGRLEGDDADAAAHTTTEEPDAHKR